MTIRRRRSHPGKRFSVMIFVFLHCLMFFFTAYAQGSKLRGYSPDAGWQYVELGTFPQSLEGGLEPILWRVLSVEGDKAYLVSEYVLANRRIHPDDVAYMLSGGAFEQTEMFAYLNGSFLESFSPAELSLLL